MGNGAGKIKKERHSFTWEGVLYVGDDYVTFTHKISLYWWLNDEQNDYDDDDDDADDN